MGTAGSVGGTVADLSGYQKDMAYLKEKSDKRTLSSDNAIYKKLDEKAKNLPNLRRFLNDLNVNYV
ncbi:MULTISPECIES: hypothetical protein [unclassified Dietzia]|uniref:hypothetical protein n=1 Tax=unclassified Dietzia TaxID=2617939 RepID=UPI0012E86CBB|nr:MULTISPECIES: hypothetical protein [unclassified Dietzia]